MKTANRNNFYILTGAPGVGKSTLLSELSKNHNVVREPAREIISEQRAVNGNGLWEKDTKLFVELLLERAISKFNDSNSVVLTFFDRGIPDNIAYAAYGELDLVRFLDASQKYRFNKKVFLLSPWEEIYVTDEERNMTFSEVTRFHNHIVEAYNQSRYDLIDVPNLSICERAEFIKEHSL